MTSERMHCRKGCGACCSAISISSPLPHHPAGKAAGIRCSNLDTFNVCSIHGTPEYPGVCQNLTPMEDMCGNTYEEAFRYLEELERLTKPEF